MKYWITEETQTVNIVLKYCFMYNLVIGKFTVPPKTPSLTNFRVNYSYLLAPRLELSIWKSNKMFQRILLF